MLGDFGGKVGRNERCPCGSGKKFKKCCGAPRQESPIEFSHSAPHRNGPYSDSLFEVRSGEEWTLLRQGENCFNAGKYMEALDNYERLLALNPGQAGSWSRLSNTYDALLNRDKKWKVALRGHEVCPNDSALLYNMGNFKLDEAVLLHNGGDRSSAVATSKEAITYFEAALRLEPTSPSCLYNAALAYWLSGDPVTANQRMTRSFQLNPRQVLPQGWHMTGVRS